MNLLTIKWVKELLAEIGYSINRTQGGDFRVIERGDTNRDHGYYTDQLDDALATAVHMHQAAKWQSHVTSNQETRNYLST